MKKFVTIIITIATLVFTSVSVFAFIGTNEYSKNNRTDKLYVKQEGKIKNKKFTVTEDEKKIQIELTYEKSRVLNASNTAMAALENGNAGDENKSVDIYVDQNNCEYHFREDGELSSFYNREALIYEGTRNEQINKEEAIRIAQKEIRRFYSEQAEELELYRYTKKDDGNHQVYFTIFFGENDFVSSSIISVEISEYGKIVYVAGRIGNRFAEFDSSLLNGVTKESIVKWVDNEIRGKYEDLTIDYEVRTISLAYKEDQYWLKISIPCVDEETSWVEVIYYPLQREVASSMDLK